MARHAIGGGSLAPGGQAFDLNIEKVLEHWPVSYAVREVIANALDETAITHSAPPDIQTLSEGEWVIRDFGRGVRYRHLTQKENVAGMLLDDDTDWSELAELLTDSYCIQAPARLADRV